MLHGLAGMVSFLRLFRYLVSRESGYRDFFRFFRLFRTGDLLPRPNAGCTPSSRKKTKKRKNDGFTNMSGEPPLCWPPAECDSLVEYAWPWSASVVNASAILFDFRSRLNNSLISARVSPLDAIFSAVRIRSPLGSPGASPKMYRAESSQ